MPWSRKKKTLNVPERLEEIERYQREYTLDKDDQSKCCYVLAVLDTPKLWPSISHATRSYYERAGKYYYSIHGTIRHHNAQIEGSNFFANCIRQSLVTIV